MSQVANSSSVNSSRQFVSTLGSSRKSRMTERKKKKASAEEHESSYSQKRSFPDRNTIIITAYGA